MAKIKIIELQKLYFEVEQTEIESFLEEYEEEVEGLHYEVDLEDLHLDSITFNKEVVINDTKYLKGDKLENIIIIKNNDINSPEQAHNYIIDKLFYTLRGVDNVSDIYNSIYENYLLDNLPQSIRNEWNLIHSDERVEIEFMEVNEDDFTIN